MSDTRRRRKSHHSGGSEDLSDSYEELNATKETESSERIEDHHDSEYDTAGSESDAESQDGGLRESGDGQEEDKPQRKLDDDEDRRNPQYIPKRGTFYEHDDRTTDEVTDTTADTQNERETKEKKVWKDKEDRWNHDRYNDDEQAPKSHEELIAVYGYDIRNEEGPPRARRRRRYGRGPNKYTRNWEDEDAYGKSAGTIISSKGNNKKINRTGEEFPALGTSSKDSEVESEEPVISSAWYSNKNKSQTKTQSFLPLQSQQENQKIKPNSVANAQHTNDNKIANEPTNPAWKKETKRPPQNQSPNRNIGGGGDADKSINVKPSPRENNKRQVPESVGLATSKARGRGFKTNANNMVTNRAMESKPKGRGAGPISADNRRNNAGQYDDDQQLVNDTKHLNINDGTFHQGGRQSKNHYAQSSGQQRPNTVPPRMQQQQSHHQQQQQSHQQQDASGNRPKRYSSLRQRPTIPESPAQQTYQPQHAQHGYYPQAGNSRSVLESQGYPQGHFEQSPPVAAPAAALAGQPVIPLPPGNQPASFAPPPFLVPPPQFMAPQSAPPNIINYVPGPNGPTFQPNFQGYQGYSPTVQPPGPPPQELFQPQGCTYYSPAQQQQQQQQQQAAPLRRPKVAIPILPPPDNQQHYQNSRGRGRSTQQLSNNAQFGNNQLEGKNDLPEGDQKIILGQFDNAQSENVIDTEQVQKDQSLDTVTLISGEAEDDRTASPSDLEEVTELPKEVMATSEVATIDSVMITNDKETVLVEPTDNMTTTESELTKVDSVVHKSPVIEEAAA